MDIFQGFGKKITDAAKSVGKRTAEATEAARLNGRIAQKKDEIEEMYTQIGKAYYAMRNTSGQDSAAEALCARIDELQQEIEELTKEVDAIRQVVRCPNCGEAQSDEASYCANCGTKLIKYKRPEPQPEPEAEQESTQDTPDGMDAEKPVASAADVTISWPEAATRAGAESTPESEEEKQED